MGNLILPSRHRASSRGRRIPGALLLSVAGLLVLVACHRSTMAPEEPLTYRIVEGACGEVVFVESIGTDSASAFEAVEARKIKQYGEGEVTLEAFALEVVDDQGNPPKADFYALRVLDSENGTHVHSVAEVITTEGDLFNLRWCPD